MNPDTLRVNAAALAIVRAFLESGKVVAAISCLLVEAGTVEGPNVTSYKSIETDVIKADAGYQQVVVDDGIITSGNSGDLDAFVGKIVEEVEAGAH